MAEAPVNCQICGDTRDKNLQWELVVKDVFNAEVGVHLWLCEHCYKAEVQLFSHLKLMHR